jgi:hypothetical protein
LHALIGACASTYPDPLEVCSWEQPVNDSETYSAGMTADVLAESPSPAQRMRAEFEEARRRRRVLRGRPPEEQLPPTPETSGDEPRRAVQVAKATLV